MNDTEQTIAITLGGDGTILHCIQNCIKFSIPILGINVGTLGFLTEIEVDQIKTAITALKNNVYGIERRRLLQLDLNGKEYVALNEVVFFRNTASLIKILLTVSDSIVDEYSSDGLIVATPTGSTAYSLSAGGSIISPESPVFALTPINAHTLRSRPMIVSDHNKIELKLLNHATANIYIDGKEVAIIDCFSKIELSKSKQVCRFVRIDGCDNFYKKLAKKLKNP
jgi:NAD+ kinase